MIRIFSADGTGPTEGSTRGPRGPKNWNIQNIAQMPGSSVQVEDFTERFDDCQKNVRISAKQIVEY